MPGTNADTNTVGWTLPTSEADYLSMVVLVNTIGDENVLYNAYPADGTGSVRLMSRARSLHGLEEEAKRFRANVVLIDSEMAPDVKALAQVIHNLRHNREAPIITVELCRDVQWLETFRKLGALVTITSPLSPLELTRLNHELPLAFLKVTQEWLGPDYHPHWSGDELSVIHSGEYHSHTISVWSSKGGVGEVVSGARDRRGLWRGGQSAHTAD